MQSILPRVEPIDIGPKMTMLNEEIVKELAKYDELFNNFSYNDVVKDVDEENDLPMDPRANVSVEKVAKEVEDDAENSSDSEKEVHQPPVEEQMVMTEGVIGTNETKSDMSNSAKVDIKDSKQPDQPKTSHEQLEKSKSEQ